MTYYPPHPPSRKPPVWPWLLGGCAVLIVAMIGFVVAMVVLIISAIRHSEPYAHAVATARKDPRVMEAIGTPIEPGFFTTGSINTNGDGDADLSIPLRGPKGNATLHVVAKRIARQWTYSAMTVTPQNGETIDLLKPP